MNEQWEEGYQAFQDGLSLDDNPYTDDGDFSDSCMDWQTGFECAEADAE